MAIYISITELPGPSLPRRPPSEAATIDMQFGRRVKAHLALVAEGPHWLRQSVNKFVINRAKFGFAAR